MTKVLSAVYHGEKNNVSRATVWVRHLFWTQRFDGICGVAHHYVSWCDPETGEFLPRDISRAMDNIMSLAILKEKERRK